MPRISRVVAIGFSHHPIKGEIIRNVFLKTKMVSGNIWDVLEITLEETS